MRRVLFTLSIFCVIGTANAQIYQCGNTIQQTPCEGSKHKVGVSKPKFKAPELDIRGIDPLAPSYAKQAWSAAQQGLSDKLKDPESVKYQNVRAVVFDYAKEHHTLICGRLNAKNSYGGYVGYKPFVVVNDKAFLDTGYAHIRINRQDYTVTKAIRACVSRGTPLSVK